MVALFQRRPELAHEHHDAWWAFLDCAELIEGARRLLLGTLPTGRVEPAPIAVGLDALATAIRDVREWMPRWRDDELAAELRQDWDDCVAALDEAEASVPRVREVAATTSELEDLLGAVEDVVAPLDAFADAERTWRRSYRLPRTRD